MKKNELKRALMVLAATAITFASPVTYAFIPNQDRCIDVKTVAAVKPLEDSFISKDMVATYMPTNMTPTTDSNHFASQFEQGLGQRITDHLFNSDFFRKSSIGQMQTKIERAASQSVEFKSSPTGVTHKVNFNVKAVERIAQVMYEGYFKSHVSYSGTTNNLEFVISKDLTKATVVSFTNTMPVSASSGSSSVFSFSHTF